MNEFLQKIQKNYKKLASSVQQEQTLIYILSVLERVIKQFKQVTIQHNQTKYKREMD